MKVLFSKANGKRLQICLPKVVRASKISDCYKLLERINKLQFFRVYPSFIYHCYIAHNFFVLNCILLIIFNKPNLHPESGKQILRKRLNLFRITLAIQRIRTFTGMHISLNDRSVFKQKLNAVYE